MMDIQIEDTYLMGTVAFSVLITFSPLARGDLLIA